MNYILFDDAARPRLLPFTHTRPVADIRCGILTMRERWELCLQKKTSTLTETYLQQVYPLVTGGASDIYVNGSIFGTHAMAEAISKLQGGHVLVKGDIFIAARPEKGNYSVKELNGLIASLPAEYFDGPVLQLKHAWDIFTFNGQAIESDLPLITKGRHSAAIPDGVTVSGRDHIFIEEGAKIYPGCMLNASTGSIYIGRNTEVLEGTMMRGPIAIGDHAVVKMAAKIYGATTIGPGCKVGGEINNAVFFANSNKAHDGYLGNAVIGEWCNLGADTNCSNLKNNYAEIKVWDEAAGKSVYTGLTFCGLMMGDHSKCGINTMFNTGTIVGVSCNIYGGGFPEKFIPSFSWGGSEGFVRYGFDRAMETAARMMERRGRQLTTDERNMLLHVFELGEPKEQLTII